MTWAAQVRHVMAKDVRHARWLLLGYAGIVVLAWAHAQTSREVPQVSSDLPAFLVVVVGVFAAGFLVQDDSPTRSDAFWASRPLQPTALLAAKTALLLLALVVPPLIALSAVLATNGLSAVGIVAQAARSAWIYGLWLFVAMLLAAVTREFRSLLVALVIIPGVMGLMTISATWWLFRRAIWQFGVVTSVAPALFTIVAAGTGTALLITLYRRRDVRRPTWGAAVAAVICSLLALLTTPAVPSVTHVPMSPLGGSARLFVELIPERMPNAGVWVGIGSAGRTDRMAVLQPVALVLQLRDGTTMRVPAGAGRLTLSNAILPVTPGTRWLRPPPNDALGGRFGLSLTRVQRERLRAGIAAASIEGKLLVWRPRIAFALPLVPGATEQREGTRVRIVTVTPAGEDTLAVVAASSVRRDAEMNEVAYLLWDSPHYVLINDARQEAVLLAGDGGFWSQSLVLPGSRRSVRTTALRPGAVRALDLSPEWLRASRLLGLDWVSQGMATVSLDAEVR
jgi:hypothetical protein